MKKTIFYLVLLSSINLFSQNEIGYSDNESNLSYTVDKISNKEINIPIYNVESNGINIPIFLTYDNRGFSPSDVPNSVGYGWSLQAGGSVDKKINHRIDESFHGWDTDADIESVLGDSNHKFLLFDTEPDFNYMNISNGDFMEYIYERNLNNVGGITRKPITRDESNNFSVSKNYHFEIFETGESTVSFFNGGGFNSEVVRSEYLAYQIEDLPYINSNDADLYFRKDNGIMYTFRKGIKRHSYYIQNPGMYENYYLHKAYKSNYGQDVKPLSFEYIDTNIKKLNLYGNGKIIKINSDPSTPVESNDSNRAGIELTGSVTDVSRKEISIIKTDKETIEFKYRVESYDNAMHADIDLNYVGSYTSQSINLLEEINMYDNSGRFIFGYKLHYLNENTTNSGLFLKSIEKVSRNKIIKPYKNFEYNFENSPLSQGEPIVNRALYNGSDALGFLNGFGVNNDENVTPLFLEDRTQNYKWPNEDYLKINMLKSITNQYGGKTEFEYKLNAYEDMYYGGLLINELKILDSDGNLIKNTLYTYNNPEGFGLSIFGDNTGDAYDKGYYNLPEVTQNWRSYFTKRDPNIGIDILDRQFTYLFFKSTPYELLNNTNFRDIRLTNLANEYNNQGLLPEYFEQQSNGFYYREIKEENINDPLQSNNGYVIKHYKPSLSKGNLNGILTKINVFNDNGIKVKENLFNYEYKYLGATHTYKFGEDVLPIVKSSGIQHIKEVLRSTEVKTFTNQGEILTNNKNIFSYLNENNTDALTDYNRITKTENYNNDIIFNKQENKFFIEYDNLPYSESVLFDYNPVIERANFIKENSIWKLKSAIVNEYNENLELKKTGIVQNNPSTGKAYTESNYVNSYFDLNNNLISLAEKFIEFTYDDIGNILAEKNLTTGITKIYQRSNEYDNLHVDAILTTLEPFDNSQNFFIKKSFENSHQDLQVVRFNKAFSGKYVFEGSSVNLGSFPNNYRVSFWAYENEKWKYYSSIHTGGNLVINKPQNAIYIDEIRVQPNISTMQSYTFNPLSNTTSALNERGEGTRSEYDVFGNLLFILDKDYNVIKEYRMNNTNN